MLISCIHDVTAYFPIAVNKNAEPMVLRFYNILESDNDYSPTTSNSISITLSLPKSI